MNTIKHNETEITFVSTAHVSKESVIEVKDTIEALQPEIVCIELDDQRARSLTQTTKDKPLDIKQIIKGKKMGMFISNLILSSYQKQIASDLDAEVGGEMKQAITSAKEIGAQIVYIDRNIQTTFKRLWNQMGLWKKAQLAATLIGSIFSKSDEITSEDIEALKSSDLLYSAIEELNGSYPEIGRVILHERNEYMAEKIKQLHASKIVVVLGAAHTSGVIEELDNSHDLTELNKTPEKKKNRILSAIIPVTIIAFLVILTLQNPQVGLQQLIFWIACSSILATLGAIISRAHPLTILVTFVSTWIGILSPVLAVGMFAGLTEAYMRPPYDTDFESITSDTKSLKGWYRNRVLRIVLIFFTTSILSSIGTFISGASIIRSLFNW